MTFRRFFAPFLITVYLVAIPTFAFADISADERAQLQQELDQLNADIAKNQAQLDSTKANTKTLQQAVNYLNNKIAQDKLLIKQKTLLIAQLNADIAVKSAHIQTLQEKIDNTHDSMAQMLRKTNELDSYSLPEVLLAQSSISDFWSDIDTFQSIDRSMGSLLAQVRSNKNLTEQEKAALQSKQDQEMDTKVAAQQAQKKAQDDKTQQEYLVAVNQSKEKTYAQIIAEQQAKVADIKAKLFHLAGGGAAIPFGTALSYAQNVQAKTGVDPAFLLAILTQESNLGSNVGKCYLTDVNTGAGVNVDTGKLWSNLMKAPRDTEPFLSITNALSYNAFKTVVSCPIGGYGYGGAMGPAQFISSTWELFADRLQSALGHFANPWDPQDAFTASGFYLSDLGASSNSYSAQIRAACKYYGSGGSSCTYGRNVMSLKSSIQSDIDYLNQYGVSRR